MYGTKRTYARAFPTWGSGGTRTLRKRSRAAALPAKFVRLQRQVALLRPELKQNSGVVSVGSIAAASGSIVLFSANAQGTSDSTRIGDQIRIQDVRFVGVVDGITVGMVYHLLVVRDNFSDGAFPTIAGASNAIMSSFDPRNSIQNIAQKKRFTIMWQKMSNGLVDTNGAMNGGIFDTGFLKCSGLTTYQDNTGGITGTSKNHYYLVVLVNGANTMNLNGQGLYRFTDV